jgi:hypothetical protein
MPATQRLNATRSLPVTQSLPPSPFSSSKNSTTKDGRRKSTEPAHFSLLCSPSKIKPPVYVFPQAATYANLSSNLIATGYARQQRGNIMPHVFKASTERIPGSG